MNILRLVEFQYSPNWTVVYLGFRMEIDGINYWNTSNTGNKWMWHKYVIFYN